MNEKNNILEIAKSCTIYTTLGFLTGLCLFKKPTSLAILGFGYGLGRKSHLLQIQNQLLFARWLQREKLIHNHYDSLQVLESMEQDLKKAQDELPQRHSDR